MDDIAVNLDLVPEAAVVRAAVQEHGVLLALQQAAGDQRGEVGTEGVDRTGLAGHEDVALRQCSTLCYQNRVLSATQRGSRQSLPFGGLASPLAARGR